MAESGLTPEQKEHVLHAATSGLIDLLLEHPELASLGAEAVGQVYMAGVVAGVDAFDRVLRVGLRDFDWPSL